MDTEIPQPPANPRARIRRDDLVAMRTELGITLADVAAEVCVSRQMIGQMETQGAMPPTWASYERAVRHLAVRTAERALRVISAMGVLALMLTGCATECDAPEPADCSLEMLCAQWSAGLWLAIVPGAGECMLDLVPWSPDVDDLGEQVCE